MDTGVSRNQEGRTVYEIPIRPRPRRATTTAPLVLTDDHGNLVVDGHIAEEPLPGSIVLTQGDWGTAWQRGFGDGLWQRMGGGRPRDWAWLIAQPRLRLVYDARLRRAGEKG